MVGALNPKRRPIACRRPPKYRSASVRLTTATGGVCARSASLSVRPATTDIPIVEKYAGLTTLTLKEMTSSVRDQEDEEGQRLLDHIPQAILGEDDVPQAQRAGQQQHTDDG